METNVSEVLGYMALVMGALVIAPLGIIGWFRVAREYWREERNNEVGWGDGE